MSRAKRKTRNRNNLIDYNNYVNKKQEVNILPRNVNQETYLATLQNQRKDIVFAIGPAGTGKTLIGVIMAIRAFKEKQVDKIVITRPAVSVDEKHGYLPGNLEQKMEPWTRPMFDIFEQTMTHNQMDRCIRIEPLGYMRGRTFSHTLIIADEMQNATPNQMKMLLTRIGEGTKLVVTGDLEQSDLGPDNGLENLVYKLQCTDLDYIEHVKMDDDDIIRHPAVNEVLKVLNA